MKSPTKNELTIDLNALSDDNLVSLRIRIENEIKNRKLKFSTTEKGEALAIEFFNSTPGLDNLIRTAPGTKNVDALSRKGERYSIKTMKDGKKSSSFFLESPLKEKVFEHLLIVILTQGYELKSLHKFSWNQFLKIKYWDSHMKAFYVSSAQKRLKVGECLYERQPD